MGVTGLWKLIEQSGTPVPPETLENKILAIDISIWLHQAVKGFQDASGAALPHAHLLGLFSRVCKLLHYRIRPVFVFDGGVPYLKRETIRKRAQNKRTYRTQADRLQKLLAESVEREAIIRHALARPGDPAASSSSSSAALSPPAAHSALPTQAGRDAMFMLPPLPLPTAADDDTADTSAAGGSLDHSGCSSTGSAESPQARNAYNIDLATIDVGGRHFLGLPADVRHDILTDLKAMRKESSWGRLHELPEQRDEFSDFQMRRLLKRRQVQQSLEQAEQEMGGASLSLGEIERLLCEDGVVDAESVGAMAKQRVMSDENRRILHVKNLRALLKEEKRTAKRTELEAAAAVEAELADGSVSPPKRVRLDVVEVIDEEGDESADEVDEADEELQRAIQMSLEQDGDADTEQPLVLDSPAELGTEFDAELQRAIQMSLEQAPDDAPGVNALPEIGTSDKKSIDDEVTSNDDLDFVEVLGQEPVVEPAADAVPKIRLSDKESDKECDDEVSSNADSDFVEVPDADGDSDDLNGSLMRPSQMSFETNVAPSPDASMDFRLADLKLEVVIDPTQRPSEVDDLFADVFVPKPELKLEEKPTAETVVLKVSPPSATKLDSILNQLNEEMHSLVAQHDVKPKLPALDDEVIEISDEIGDNLYTIPEPPPKLKQQDIGAFITITPKKSKSPPSAGAEPETPPPYVKSPFFHKKTPGSSGKKAAVGQPAVSAVSSAKKSLFPDTESADNAPAAPPPPSAADLHASAVSALRDARTADELAAMATSTRQQTHDLLLERNKQDRLGVSITDRMSDDCKRLLRIFGIPFVVAPMEAEAQCAYLNAARLTDGTITDDSDIWLFGGRTVYRHFFDQDKRVMEFRADEVQRMFQVERTSLIQMAMLVGSDYTTGVPGIGTVTALEILSAFPAAPAADADADAASDIGESALLDALRRFRNWFGDRAASANRPLRRKLKNIVLTDDFPRAQIAQSYLSPDVRADLEAFSWRTPDAETLREFAKTTFGWTFARTDETLLPVLRRLQEKRSQQSIRNYFATDGRIDRREVAVSKRVRRAIDMMARPAGEAETETETEAEAAATAQAEPDVEKPKRAQRKTKATKPAAGAEAAAAATTGRRTRAAQASTSAGPASPAKRKAAGRVPDLRPAIPQRELDLAEQRKRKERAVEIFKQSPAKKKGK